MPSSMFDALYCEEEHWDDGEEIIDEEIPSDRCSTEGEGNSNFSDDYLSHRPFLKLLEENLSGQDDELRSLLVKERENEVSIGFEDSTFPVKARGEAVEWMLMVVGYYSFSALTAVLAVNCFDRFLYSFKCHREKPWMAQLAAVACLSLAAKVEEAQVPLLLDLQVESMFVFESKTIQRMEILVLSTLQWKMHPVTPRSFLDYMARRLEMDSNLSKVFLGRCECLLLSIVSDCRYLCCLPSALATATMLYFISSVEPRTAVQCQDQLISMLGTRKEKVEDCCRLIQDVHSSAHLHSNNKRKFGSCPDSPKRVMEVSCSSESATTGSCSDATLASVSSSPEPVTKKTKSQSPNHAIF